MLRSKRLVAHGDSPMIVRMAMAMTLPPRRVRKNKAGDWIAYEGRERVGNFGSNEARAKAWAEH